MSNRASSSRAEAERRPWYGEPWPWLLAAGPLAVIVASVCTAWLAVKSDDGLVADDYYKRGLLINRKLAHTPAGAASTPSATVRFGEGGEVRVRLDEASGAPLEAPATLRLRLAHPEHLLPEQVVTLARHANGEYLGMLAEQTPGRWLVVLESDAWRLPETTVAGRLTEIRISAAPGRP